MADPQAPRKARITHYYFYDATEDATCPVCGWQGAYGETDREFYEELFDCSCPGCGKMLLIVGCEVDIELVKQEAERGNPRAIEDMKIVRVIEARSNPAAK
jgi:hypothetical protein